MQKTHNSLIKGIKDYFRKCGIKKAVIGVSGGIDSALSARLVSDAIGYKNITALLLPEKAGTTNVIDSINLCKKLCVKYKLIEINNTIDHFKKSVSWAQNKASLVNLKSRIRAVILYNYANSHDALVIGTSNKTELELGYYTKYGDGACDIEVIGSLYKTQVIALAKHLDLPKEIINKTPSADLYPGQSDEKEIGETYANIDKMLTAKIKMSKKIKALIDKNKHKGDIPIIKK
ncbi:MAG: NAD+ synthase [Nanoarchaeota archaeon]